MFNLGDKKFYKIMKIIVNAGWISKDDYLKITNMYKYNGVLTCEICKEPINNQNNNRKFSINHKLPKAYGGTDLIDNLEVAHRKCNSDQQFPHFKRIVGNIFRKVKYKEFKCYKDI